MDEVRFGVVAAEVGVSSAEDFYGGGLAARHDPGVAASGVGFDVPAVFVEQMVVEVADEHQVGEFCWAAVGPVDDVVGVQTAGRVAAQELAAVLVPPV